MSGGARVLLMLAAVVAAGCGPDATAGWVVVELSFGSSDSRCATVVGEATAADQAGEAKESRPLPRSESDRLVALVPPKGATAVRVFARGHLSEDCTDAVPEATAAIEVALTPGRGERVRIELRERHQPLHEVCGNGADDDGNGKADCADPACTSDAFYCPAPPTFLAPLNFDPAVARTQPRTSEVLVNCGETVFDSTSATFTNWCTGTKPTPWVIDAQGVETVVLMMERLHLAAGSTLRLVGRRPVVLAVFGDATVGGTLSADSKGGTLGAGAEAADCAVARGGNGVDEAGGGAAGGSFGSPGGLGGNGNGESSSAGSLGTVTGAPVLSPLRAGCAGGSGGASGEGSARAAGGAGGGAVGMWVQGTLMVQGRVTAGGAGGAGASFERSGGGGGGSGGAILLEATRLELAEGAVVVANGGAGGGGNRSESSFGLAGEDALLAPHPAQGGLGGSGAGNGGSAAALAQSAQAGVSGGEDRGGGGGGGGVGRISLRGRSCLRAKRVVVSPSPYSVDCPP